MQKKGNTYYLKNVCNASLFALALLVLVVSCPLKRLFMNTDVSQTSMSFGSNRASTSQYTKDLDSGYSNCSGARDKISLFQVDKSQRKIAEAPVFTANIFNHTGYYIYTFLDGIKARANFALYSTNSSLPLFLRHRSILI